MLSFIFININVKNSSVYRNAIVASYNDRSKTANVILGLPTITSTYMLM